MSNIKISYIIIGNKGVFNMVKLKTIISERRKALNLTQKELAKKINVSDKVISKWETGNSYPDTTLLKSLAEALEITVNELLDSAPNDQGNNAKK